MRNRNSGSIARRWPWWLRSPHSRLFSEWIELKTDQPTEDGKGDAHAPAA